jgi:hypothetical protein
MHYVDVEGITSKKISIRSLYHHLTREDNDHANTSIWKAKILEKNKDFYVPNSTEVYTHKR